ncbi:MAG: CHAD domain-containing protein [Desulfobacterales bacterium]|jgi:CHAD domain-containing protein
MIKNQKFNLPDGYDEKQLIDQLAGQYAIKKMSRVDGNLTLYDTFDWRLFNKSLILYSSANRLVLRKLKKSDILHNIEFSRMPVFIWDFPDGDFKKRLAPIIKMRALLKRVEVQARSMPYNILNADEKTVARLVFEEVRPAQGRKKTALARHLWLKPIKGYPKYERLLAKCLRDAGLKTGTEKEFFLNVLALADRAPGSYSSKVNIQLDPAMRSDEATKIILRLLLKVMRTNEAVFEKDLDTEVLHDFRVAIRRTRSALAQIKNVFPARTTARFKKDFADVGKRSNALRDLDVYLLNQESYKKRLPAVLRDDIDPLFEYLREKRAKAFQHVMRGLKSKKYGQIIKDWETFLDKPPPDTATAANAMLPVIELARSRIYKKFRGIVKTGNKILANTEDEMLHALRIECKKLRYLMEFFANLFPRKKINALIAQLKNLQDNLGDFNDLCVQQEYLLNIATELTGGQQQLKKTLVAIGSLVEALNREKQTVRDAFARTFTDFSAPANQALFRELFATKIKNIEN